MNKILVPLSVAALLLLSGCGSDATNAEAPEVDPAGPASSSDEANSAEAEATETAAPAEPEGEKSERGNLIKAIGEGAGITWEGKEVASFVVNSIAVDPGCTNEFATEPENGHFVVLDVSLKTEPELAEAPSPSFGLAGIGWTAIAPNGTTSNADTFSGAAFMCLDDSEVLPSALGPGEQATGKIVLDVENPEGVLVHKPLFQDFGWEWSYPA